MVTPRAFERYYLQARRLISRHVIRAPAFLPAFQACITRWPTSPAPLADFAYKRQAAVFPTGKIYHRLRPPTGVYATGDAAAGCHGRVVACLFSAVSRDSFEAPYARFSHASSACAPRQRA